MTGFTKDGMNPFLHLAQIYAVEHEEREIPVADELWLYIILNPDGEYISDAAQQFDEKVYGYIPSEHMGSDKDILQYLKEHGMI